MIDYTLSRSTNWHFHKNITGKYWQYEHINCKVDTLLILIFGIFIINKLSSITKNIQYTLEHEQRLGEGYCWGRK